MRYLAVLATAILFLPIGVYAKDGNSSKYDVEVMVQNQYLGTSLASIIEALGEGATPQDLTILVIDAVREIIANETVERLDALAESLADKKPHLVALQEVVQLSCEPLNPNVVNPCVSLNGVLKDHLELTLELVGAEYVDAAVQENISVSFPLDLSLLLNKVPDGNADVIVSVKDRDVILVRRDIEYSIVDFDSLIVIPNFECDGEVDVVPLIDEDEPRKDGCTYPSNVKFPDIYGNFVSVNRGFVGVDATVGGKVYRFVNTHLEIQSPFQSLQAAELLAVLKSTGEPEIDYHRLLVAGDFNSDPTDGPYEYKDTQLLIPYQILTEEGGLTDVWLSRPGKPKGYTCCQDPDLMNEFSKHKRRVDMVFADPPPTQVKANVLDDELSDKIDTGFGTSIWPSDHSGVSVRLKYPD